MNKFVEYNIAGNMYAGSKYKRLAFPDAASKNVKAWLMSNCGGSQGPGRTCSEIASELETAVPKRVNVYCDTCAVS
jgi:hypothetical protein